MASGCGHSTYYFQTALRFEGKSEAVNFIVPTGNMGNLFSAYIAKLMGAPIGKMMASSNENDIVPRLFSDQILRPEKTKATLSPSMDIQIPSNLERLIWLNKDKDAVGTQSVYRMLEKDGDVSFRKPEMERLMKQFGAFRCSERNAIETMRFHRASTNRYICPHSATAFAVADRVKPELDGPIVCIETAHAAKFPEASQRAFSSQTALPNGLQRLSANAVFKTSSANLRMLFAKFLSRTEYSRLLGMGMIRSSKLRPTHLGLQGYFYTFLEQVLLLNTFAGFLWGFPMSEFRLILCNDLCTLIINQLIQFEIRYWLHFAETPCNYYSIGNDAPRVQSSPAAPLATLADVLPLAETAGRSGALLRMLCPLF